MKKIVILVLILIGMAGCNPSGVVSDNAVREALDIVYEETKNNDYKTSWGGLDYRFRSFAIIKEYVQNQGYRNNLECGVIDESDVEGKKYIKACLLKNANKENKNPNILIKAIPFPNQKDMMFLVFFQDAERTEKGFSYNTLLPVGIVVNLDSRKIGKL
ncbi:MAG: hypothetical protein MR993_06105 [Spirochaetes bacterium]|nr:hypothetical protein [Spirochaetota bacterium]